MDWSRGELSWNLLVDISMLGARINMLRSEGIVDRNKCTDIVSAKNCWKSKVLTHGLSFSSKLAYERAQTEHRETEGG